MIKNEKFNPSFQKFNNEMLNLRTYWKFSVISFWL